MSGGLRDALNALQDVFQALVRIDESVLRVRVVVQRVVAANLIRRLGVEGDEGTGVPLLLFDSICVRALVELRSNCLDRHLLAEKNCGADQAGEEEFGAKIGSVP